MAGGHDQQIRAALEELLNWPPLQRSPQLGRFLDYIVSAKLSGGESGIKAYSVAVDVFGRPPTFDPQTDPIVRVQARRLRALLEQYYAEGDGHKGVRIVLPTGRYVPEFVPFEPAAERRSVDTVPAESATTAMGEVVDMLPKQAAAAPVSPTRRRLPWQAFAIGALVFAVAVFLVLRAVPPHLEPSADAPPTMPIVSVEAFTNLSGVSDLDPVALEIATEVRNDLGWFEDLKLVPPGDTRAGYRLGGVINPTPQGVEVTATLTGGGSGAIWSATYARTLPEAMAADDAASLARAIVREVAPFRGPLHLAGRRWLDAQLRPLAAVNSYVCLLTYRLAREMADAAQIADAIACHEKLLREQPGLPVAISALAVIKLRVMLTQRLPDPELPNQLGDAAREAERARAMAPDSSLVREHLGTIENWQQRFDASARDFAAALRLNPLNTDARAGYAIMLARALDWPLGGEQASLAIADTPYPSPWYYYPVAVNALRSGNMVDALKCGRKATRYASGEIGTIIALVAAFSLGQTEDVEELRTRLLGMENLRRAGVMPWLAGQVTDPTLLAQIETDLGRAGVPRAALTAAF